MIENERERMKEYTVIKGEGNKLVSKIVRQDKD